jgi:hypothetical protein
MSLTLAERTPRRILLCCTRNSSLFIVILASSLGLRLLVAAALGAGFDEAYYYSYSLRPALSYFDHPPIVSFLIRLCTHITGVATPFTIRLGAVFVFTVSGLLFCVLSRKMLKKEEALLAYGVFNFTPLFAFCAGIAILPDTALVFFWIACLCVLQRLLSGDRNTLIWVLAGVLTGGAMLSKYHGVLLALSLFLYLLMYDRRVFLTFGPYLYAVSAVIVFLPVIVWNWQQDFVSFLFQGTRAFGTSISIQSLLTAIGGQMLYLTPLIFVVFVYVLWQTITRGLIAGVEEQRFFFFFGTLPIVIFNVISVFKPILPHWTLVGYIVLIIPFVRLLEEHRRRWPVVNSVIAWSVLALMLVYLLSVLHARYGIFHLERLVDKGWMTEEEFRADPTLDLIGWEEIDLYLSRNDISAENTFLFSHRWFLSGEIELATRGRYTVMCFNKSDARAFGIWDSSLDMQGKNGLFVCTDRYPAKPEKEFASYFESFSKPDTVTIERGGVPSKRFYFYRCNHLLKKYPLPGK